MGRVEADTTVLTEPSQDLVTRYAREEIGGVCPRGAVYRGSPAANEAFGIAGKVFADEEGACAGWVGRVLGPAHPVVAAIGFAPPGRGPRPRRVSA